MNLGNEWRAHVEHPMTAFGVTRVYLYRRIGPDGEIEIVNSDGTTTRVEQGAETPDGAGLTIPRDAWEALVAHAAAQSHLGREVQVLREWLKHEQSRVDSVIDTARAARI
jgi:hypothetical protein